MKERQARKILRMAERTDESFRVARRRLATLEAMIAEREGGSPGYAVTAIVDNAWASLLCRPERWKISTLVNVRRTAIRIGKRATWRKIRTFARRAVSPMRKFSTEMDRLGRATRLADESRRFSEAARV